MTEKTTGSAEVMRQNDGQREQCKGNECGDDERLSSDHVGNLCCRKIHNDRGGGLHRDQHAVLRSADSDDAHHVDHSEFVDQPLAGSDEHIGEQEPAQRSGK